MSIADESGAVKSKLPDGWTGVQHRVLLALGDPTVPTPSDPALVTLFIIRAHCGTGNPCTAALATIAHIHGIARSTVKRHVRELEQLGLITVRHRPSDRGDSDTNEIRLTSAGQDWFHNAVASEMNPGRSKCEPGGESTNEPGGRANETSTIEPKTCTGEAKCEPRGRATNEPGGGPNLNPKEDKNNTNRSAHSASDAAVTGKRGAKSTPNPRIKIILDHFHDEHLRIHGEKPHIIGGRDTAAIKRVLKTIADVNELKRRITAYLNDPLSWMNPPQWTMTGFEKRLNAYVDPSVKRPAPSPRNHGVDFDNYEL